MWRLVPIKLVAIKYVDVNGVKQTVRAWRAADREAMAELGFTAMGEDGYATDLDSSGDWVALVGLPKQYGGWRGQTVAQELPQAGLRHRPTEELIAALKGVPDDPAATTIGIRLDADLPEEQFPALGKVEAADESEVPAAVAETVRTVREFFLPYLRERADPDWLREYFERTPGQSFRTTWLERRAVLRMLAGDLSGAAEALAEFAAETGNTGIDEIDIPDRAFVAGLRDRLRQSS
jgi:hypothetical protein